MAVRIRMKKMGRAHRPYFRICAIDKRAPRDGRVLELLGTYDPMIADTDARAQLDKERIDYWLSVGAQPSEKCAVLIKKYGNGGTHVAQQEAALEKLAAPKSVPDPGAPASKPKQPDEDKAADSAEAAPAAEAKSEEASSGEASADASEEKPAEEQASDDKAEAKAEAAKEEDAKVEA